MLLAQAVELEDLRRGAGFAEYIVNTDAAHGSGQLLGKQAANRLAQTADDTVLLTGDDLAALLGGGEDQLLALLDRNSAPLSVRIGPELGVKGLEDCAVAAAKYKAGPQTGTVSVIGPARMPYGKVLSTLYAVGSALSELMGE